MADLMNTNLQTPIEIALGIDENGMTTAKKLYEFLELNPSNYSKWYKTNITDNEFATENEDYFYSSFSTSELGRGNFAQDFKLTAHFAKKLSMKGKGEKAEQAREYFARVEERAKMAIISQQPLSPQLQLFKQMFDAVVAQEIEIQKTKALAQKAVETTEHIKEAIKPVNENWREEMNMKFNRIQKNTKQQFNELRNEMYAELERRAGCDLNTRLHNRKKRMTANGCSKTEINHLSKMNIIEEDKKLREIFSKIVTEYEIKYCA